MSKYYTFSQCESAREELIGAYIGVSPKHAMTLDSIETSPKVTLKRPTQETHLTSGKEKRRGRSVPLISDRHFQQSKLLTSLSELSPLVLAWIDAAYHSKDSAKLAVLLGTLYRDSYRVRKGTEDLVELVIDVSITKATVSVQGVVNITDSQVAAHLGRSRRAYRDNWKDKVDFLHQLLADIDEAVIDHVCALLGYKLYKPSIKPNLRSRKALLYAAII